MSSFSGTGDFLFSGKNNTGEKGIDDRDGDLLTI